MTRKVDFLVSGVQKGGTSALFEYLREVPGLHLPDVKEAHFFDDEEQDWDRPDEAAYHALFPDRPGRWGEATPIYLYWPNAIERIARYNPAMRMILIFRDPVERAWSHWKMEYAKRKEREPFAWCIREGRARLTPGDPQAPGHHRVFSYVERGYYGAQVERLLRSFPRTQCLFLRSEDLRTDPAGTIASVCAFLGVAPPANVLPRSVRAARDDIDYPSRLTAEDLVLLRGLYQADLARFEALTGIDLGNWSR
ncbi:MAG: sulfotransferase domain-containing protein [Pseudomonadota bacterium]|uniref:sulfotransferase domain-containing protein n=1 Tax=Rhizorhabdus phycosphaerae TaxID=2711156 RepID=UPI0013E9BBB9|nr:sulfotransferase domain-containing protein [Rhizorhabdus phycosphaerae]